jgi:hypothetical protein
MTTADASHTHTGCGWSPIPGGATPTGGMVFRGRQIAAMAVWWGAVL